MRQLDDQRDLFAGLEFLQVSHEHQINAFAAQRVADKEKPKALGLFEPLRPGRPRMKNLGIDGGFKHPNHRLGKTAR